MTLTDIEIFEVTIPDKVVPCWVFTKDPTICPDSIAEWKVWVAIPKTYNLCTACRDRWNSYGAVRKSERL